MPNRWEGWLSLLFFAAAACLLAAGLYYYFAPAASTAPALDAETDVEVAGCVAGETRDVMLRMHNRSFQPIRILGQVR